MHGMDKFYY